MQHGKANALDTEFCLTLAALSLPRAENADNRNKPCNDVKKSARRMELVGT